MNHKIGLALGGGGARGSFQIGVIQALREKGILKQIKYVSGTSIGAINTLFVMGDYSFEHMLSIWDRIDNDSIYNSKRFKLDKQGLFDLQGIYSLLSKDISVDEIRNSHVKGFATVAKMQKESLVDQVMITRLEKEVLDLNKIDDPREGALASSSMPLFFGSLNVKDNYYVDGGMIDNCPVQPLIDAGCDIIIAVPINGGMHPKAYRSSNILLANIEPHYIFNPIVKLDVVDFDPKKVRERADYGIKLAHYMIDKLAEKGFFNPEDKSWNKPEEYTYIRISLDEEIRLKWRKE